ncbi:c-type cytochrome [Candidatus Leptofilum sp.]|uniref:c-type cytochrome n=1 Tax=Candidatus Leptofilum sp. TaxID=3241576 RepID=UPI003B5A780B
MKTKNTFWFILMILLLVGLAACGGGGDDRADSADSSADEETAVVSTGDPEAGKQQYDQVCIACHGPGGEGIEGLGKPFTTSDFLQETNDEEMLEFIKVGRPSGDPLNTTGVDMPPKGGNPALTDEQILDIIAYVRTLQ